MIRLTLHPHACTAITPVRSLHLNVQTVSDGALILHFELDADAAQLLVPPLRPPAIGDGLWRHTCFELFAAAASKQYREFNFSPSSQFAIYDFTGYRAGMRPVAPREAPSIESLQGGLSMRVRVPAELLNLDDGPATSIGVAAVIESRSGALSYWAVHHPGDAPDFHHRDGFVVAWPPRVDIEEHRS